ncbi:MAG: hypothetical protein FWG64_10115 [Firmicutes bacterium]|nr:hypothetical protein [Bacillota bacterium]
MKYNRIQQNAVDVENAISFRQYVEGLEQRYREDRQAYREEVRLIDERRIADNEKMEQRRITDNEKMEQRRIADNEKMEQRRIADNEKAEQRRIAENEKAEQSRKEDYAKFQKDMATHREEIQSSIKDLQITFRNNIFIPFIVALVIVIAGLLLPIALSNWRDFIISPQAQPLSTENIGG